MLQMLSRLFEKVAGWKPGGRSVAGGLGQQSRAAALPSEEPALAVFSPRGNCAGCCHYRVHSGNSGNALHEGDRRGSCAIRGFDIAEPADTFCKNFNREHEPPMGAIYAIVAAQKRVALPQVELTVPRVAPATCCICNERNEAGICLEFTDEKVECCGPEHYLAWWADYLSRRLAYFKQFGEKAYSDMYDVVSSSAATAYYSDAKEAFYSAISTARDLELVNEQRALEKRLAHIKAVFRSQFT